jgi:hypothetical protein
VVSSDKGRFLSVIDPPAQHADLVAGCRSEGLYPALVGDPSAARTVLSAPIIVGDHPHIAPESPGDLFDNGEIDEILTLRILTLTEEEKRQAREWDPRVAAMLDRTESLGQNDLLRLHGAVRERSDRVGTARPGTRVRLRPRARADAFDVVLAGMSATVESVVEDYEGRTQLAVTLDDDPGRDLGKDGFPGHRFFFFADEVEVLP